MPFPREEVHFSLLRLTEINDIELQEMKYEIENSEDGILNAHSYEYKFHDLDMEIYICENSFQNNIVFKDVNYNYCTLRDICMYHKLELNIDTSNERELVTFLENLYNCLNNNFINLDLINKYLLSSND